MKRAAFLGAFALSLTAGGCAPDLAGGGAPSSRLSAYRARHETHADARRRRLGPPAEGLASDSGSPWALQRPLDSVDLTRAPHAPSLESIRRLFADVRDARDLRWGARPDFSRRIPWLYVEDGCFLRAQKAVRRARATSGQPLGQVFLFGDLSLSSPHGDATWWFHVAPILRHGDALYVLDPSVEPMDPLPLHEWIRRIAPDPDAVRAVVCAADAVDPEGDCWGATSETWEAADEDLVLQGYLELEWDHVASLGWDALSVLGDFPPWR